MRPLSASLLSCVISQCTAGQQPLHDAASLLQEHSDHWWSRGLTEREGHIHDNAHAEMSYADKFRKSFPGWVMNVTDAFFAPNMALRRDSLLDRAKEVFIEDSFSMSSHMAHSLWEVAKDTQCYLAMDYTIGIWNFLQVGTNFHYGNFCGIDQRYANNASENPLRCGPSALPAKDITSYGVTQTVCNDSGMDTCCAAHDLARVYLDTSALGVKLRLHECGANHNLLKCTMQTDSDSDQFFDGNETEHRARAAAMCAYRHFPCLIHKPLPHEGEKGRAWKIIWPALEAESEPPDEPCFQGDCYHGSDRHLLDLDIDVQLPTQPMLRRLAIIEHGLKKVDWDHWEAMTWDHRKNR